MSGPAHNAATASERSGRSTSRSGILGGAPRKLRTFHSSRAGSGPGALGMRRAQRSPRVFDATILQARLYSRGHHPAPAELAELWSTITRRDGAAFLHRAAGLTAEHRRHAHRTPHHHS